MTGKKGVVTFLKAQFSAFTGGIVDILAMIFFTEVVGIHYTLSIAFGGIIGALVNFSINRSWTFRSKSPNNGPIDTQLLRFCIVVAGSILLKSAGTFVLTESLGMDYRLSRILTDIVVSLGFNYTLQKNWVFVTARSAGSSVRRSQDDRDKL
ncbi:putative flippase GtrA [Arcticibacter pallidicorallinus]|uniref:Putative flippase GtrA n=1 Tax=Arcticibacter pallidicorallinus TaxID=1259464 RepID=A0A2T0U9J9_9SPHI|nr:GtrA family protein [Arcticibacter pallidicorallinus]PRY54615.1 putative flippase GtrA [Arcticibacter pallidicorallinus]